MNNENPVLSLETADELAEIESMEAEQAKKQQEGWEETDNVIKSEEEHAAGGGTGAEKIEEGEAETGEEMQGEEQQDVKDGKWDGFGDEELKIRKYREEYAHDLELEGDFGIRECEAEEEELENKSGEKNSETRQKKMRDDLVRLLKIADMKQLNEEEAALVVKELELSREKCEQEIKFAKINCLLKLEKCFNAEGDDRKGKIEEFISKDQSNYLKAIVDLKITIALIDDTIEKLKGKPDGGEGDNTQSPQEERSKEKPEENSVEKGKSLRKKAWGGAKKVANWLGLAGIISVFGLSRIFSWKKLDKWIKKVTGKNKIPFGMEGSDDKK